MSITSLTCRECLAQYALEASFCCPGCFGPLEARYEISEPADVLRRRIEAGPQTIWRYADFLPLTGPAPSTGLGAGWTPLVRADRLAAQLGIGELWVKADNHNPTHSFKDRVVAVAAARAQELGFDTLACASTGNLANSVAAHAAALGMDSYVFVPADLEPQKITASAVYGGHLVRVRGSYDDVNRLCTEIAGEREWAFVNINLRPYYAEGSKTVGYEIVEQLGFRTPDRIVAPVASGSLYTKIASGIEQWKELGLVEGCLPVMHGAQADGCAPVAAAFDAGADVCRPVRPSGIASSLAIGNPADGPYALDLARRSGGSIEAVSDQQICDGVRLLASTTGIFTEAAGGVTTAALAQLAAREDLSGERVVLVITGDGLKTPDVAGPCTGVITDANYAEFCEVTRQSERAAA
jgi:threonine synthase